VTRDRLSDEPSHNSEFTDPLSSGSHGEPHHRRGESWHRTNYTPGNSSSIESTLTLSDAPSRRPTRGNSFSVPASKVSSDNASLKDSSTVNEELPLPPAVPPRFTTPQGVPKKQKIELMPMKSKSAVEAPVLTDYDNGLPPGWKEKIIHPSGYQKDRHAVTKYYCDDGRHQWEKPTHRRLGIPLNPPSETSLPVTHSVAALSLVPLVGMIIIAFLALVYYVIRRMRSRAPKKTCVEKPGSCLCRRPHVEITPLRHVVVVKATQNRYQVLQMEDITILQSYSTVGGYNARKSP